MTTQLSAWVLLLLAAVNTTIANLMLKHSRSLVDGEDLIGQFLQPFFIGGLFFFGINVLLYAKALDTLKVSVAYPVLAASGFMLLILASGFILGEQLSGKQYVGVLVVLAGVYLLAGD